MDIVVTGGAGFIGSHLTESLLAAGHRVRAVDNFSTGSETFLHRMQHHPNLTVVRGSAEDGKLLSGLLGTCDIIFHLAAVLGVKNTVEDPLGVIEGNIDGTRAVLAAAYRFKRKVVFTSTSEVYGKNPRLPFAEDDDRVLGAPSVHRWSYATAKALDEHLCFAYAERGLPVTVLRYFNAYGPRQMSSAYGGVVSRFVTAALAGRPLEVHGDGSQTRCFTYVADTVAGTMKAMAPAANGLAFNIGSQTPVTIAELARLIRDAAGSSSPIVNVSYEAAYGKGFEDMPARMPDIARAARILGYRPAVGLREGLRLTVDWYRRQAEGAAF